MRISDWSSDVCSSDLICCGTAHVRILPVSHLLHLNASTGHLRNRRCYPRHMYGNDFAPPASGERTAAVMSEEPTSFRQLRSEEHTSELQSLMRISYAVFCLKKKKTNKFETTYTS